MELKPCPFCGGEIRIARLYGGYGEPWYARCDRCDVSGYYYNTEAQAIEAWSDQPEDEKDGYLGELSRMRLEVELLRDENAKLRELMLDMRHFLMRLGVDYGEE